MKKEIIKLTKIIIMALVLTTGISFATWNNPTSAPAITNVPAPINAGQVSGYLPPPQNKSGGLSIIGGASGGALPTLFNVGGANFYGDQVIEDSAPFAGPKDLSVGAKVAIGQPTLFGEDLIVAGPNCPSGSPYNSSLPTDCGTIRVRSLAHDTSRLPNLMKVCSGANGELVLCENSSVGNHGHQEIHSSMTTWTPPPDATNVWFEAYGGGGGGGGGGGTNVSSCSPCTRVAGGGAGGGSGSYGISQLLPVAPGSTFTININGGAGSGGGGGTDGGGGTGAGSGGSAVVIDNDPGVANGGVIVRGIGGGGGGAGNGNGCGGGSGGSGGVDNSGGYYLSVNGNPGNSASGDCSSGSTGSAGGSSVSTSQITTAAAAINFGGFLVMPGATIIGVTAGTVGFGLATSVAAITIGNLGIMASLNPIITAYLVFSANPVGSSQNGIHGTDFSGTMGGGGGASGSYSSGTDTRVTILGQTSGSDLPADGGHGGSGGYPLVIAYW